MSKDSKKNKATKKVEKVKEKNKEVTKKKKEKKPGVFSKIRKFFADIIAELKKVKWPSKSDFLKYTSATLFFIVFFALFFLLSDTIIYGLKQLVR